MCNKFSFYDLNSGSHSSLSHSAFDLNQFLIICRHRLIHFFLFRSPTVSLSKHFAKVFEAPYISKDDENNNNINNWLQRDNCSNDGSKRIMRTNTDFLWY